MKSLLGWLMALVVLVTFSTGCGMVSKTAKVKCPKCGAVFTVDDGIRAIEAGG